jgi:hypothetical protein
MDVCPHHPGASGIVADVDCREARALETAHQLAMNAHSIAVRDVLGTLREITELVPDHQETGELIALAEDRVAKCHSALVDALTYLSTASLTDFAEALDRAASLDPNDPLGVDACVGARDLASLCRGVHDRIAKAVRARDYPRAMQLTRKHRRFLATLTSRARRILTVTEDPTPHVSRRSL